MSDKLEDFNVPQLGLLKFIERDAEFQREFSVEKHRVTIADLEGLAEAGLVKYCQTWSLKLTDKGLEYMIERQNKISTRLIDSDEEK